MKRWKKKIDIIDKINLFHSTFSMIKFDWKNVSVQYCKAKSTCWTSYSQYLHHSKYMVIKLQVTNTRNEFNHLCIHVFIHIYLSDCLKEWSHPLGFILPLLRLLLIGQCDINIPTIIRLSLMWSAHYSWSPLDHTVHRCYLNWIDLWSTGSKWNKVKGQQWNSYKMIENKHNFCRHIYAIKWISMGKKVLVFWCEHVNAWLHVDLVCAVLCFAVCMCPWVCMYVCICVCVCR